MRRVFFLGEPFIGGRRIEIEEELYQTCLQVKLRLEALSDIEDSFSLLAMALIEFESYLLTTSVRNLYGDEGCDFRDFGAEVRTSLNLKLLSVLNCSRVFEEQAYRCLSQHDSNALFSLETIKGLFRSAFDSSFEYRVMYQLRNHAMHHSLPVGLISFGQTHQSKSDRPSDRISFRHRYTIDIGIDVQELQNSDRLNKKVRRELEGIPKKFLDLKYFLRGFAGKLGEAHQGIAEHTEELFATSLKEIEDFASLLQELGEADPNTLS